MELKINTNSGLGSLINNDVIEEEMVNLSKKSIKNNINELNNLPLIIQSYLRENNLAIVTFNNIESYHIVRGAYLKKSENARAKDFIFQFNENNLYYFFITKEENPNYLKPKVTRERNRSAIRIKIDKNKEDDENKENTEINLNFDYNRFLLKSVLLKVPNTPGGKTEVFKTDLLDREVCQVSNSTLESIDYYKAKSIKPEKSKQNFEKFDLLLEKYYILEIESKKPPNETIIKEDGIISVLYLMTPSKNVTINLFTMIKYSLYFIKETLYNYIGKYIHDMIYDFCHLPSDCFTDFLSHIGCLSQAKGSNFNIVFPLKKYIQTLESLSQKNLINHMYRNLPNITKVKSADRIPFHKFILMLEKYKQYYATKEYKVKQKYLNGKKAKNYVFLKPSLIFDPINDKITKEHKINMNNVIKTFLEILEKFFIENLSKDKRIIRNFMIQNLSKFLTQYTSFKGFFNLDIIMNEDNVFEFRCTANKECNRAINNNMFGCVVGLLGCINYLFGFNEGFFHKHFTIMEYSYNFNEKNVIHTFLECNDSSKKNKVRLFDIPFMEKWNYQVAGLLLYIYREKFGFLSDNINISNNQELNNKHSNFAKLFDEINKNISNDLFLYYEDVLPDYYKFCKSISNSPLNKYNCLDNLCQNFTNNSVITLLKKNVIFFNPFEGVYKINQKHLLNYPNLNSILEPYLIMVDERYKLYLDKKEKKEQYLKDNNLNEKIFYEQLKMINIEKVHYSIFMKKDKNDKDKDIDKEKLIEADIDENEEEEIEDKKDEDEINNIENNNIISTSTISNKVEKEPVIGESYDVEDIYPEKMHKVSMKTILPEKIPKELFDFYFLLNLYYNYSYETIKELKTIFSNYDIIKRYIASIESSITITFNEIDRTIIKTTQKNKYDVKEIKKKQKKGLIKDLIILRKLTNLTRRMNYIFCEYMNGVIQDIINDQWSSIAYKNELGKKHYLKIGHYMIDFLAYEKKGINFNSFKYFETTDIYKKLFDNDNMINTSGNIDN